MRAIDRSGLGDDLTEVSRASWWSLTRLLRMARDLRVCGVEVLVDVDMEIDVYSDSSVG